MSTGCHLKIYVKELWFVFSTINLNFFGKVYVYILSILDLCINLEGNYIKKDEETI